MPDDVPFDPQSLVGHFLVSAALGLGAVLLVTGNGDLFGREPGVAFRLVVGIGILGLSAWLTVGVVRRWASGDPAIRFSSDALHLHIHPGRPLGLSLDEVTQIGPVCQLNSRFDGRRLVLGKRYFEISTTRTGVRAVRVLVGCRAIAADLVATRQACDSWLHDRRA